MFFLAVYVLFLCQLCLLNFIIYFFRESGVCFFFFVSFVCQHFLYVFINQICFSFLPFFFLLQKTDMLLPNVVRAEGTLHMAGNWTASCQEQEWWDMIFSGTMRVLYERTVYL